MSNMTPREIVHELDKHIIGQDDAKRAVAIALRNRWRRMKLPADLRDEVVPKNILMIGPTGVGKTEIARRLAKLAQAPFIKVEATKFTEVGYVGRDVESIIRDLAECSVKMAREKEKTRFETMATEAAEQQIIDILMGSDDDSVEAKISKKPGIGFANEPDETDDEAINRLIAEVDEDASADAEFDEATQAERDLLLQQLRDGDLDDREVEVDLPAASINMEIMGPPGMEEMTQQLQDMFQSLSGQRKKKRKLKVRDAFKLLKEEEASKRVNEEDTKLSAIENVEQNGIVFIDEIDKVCKNEELNRGGGDVSREGVQRDLLPLVEGSTVSTKYGMIKTDHILFIASGAFHLTKPADLIPELQGRLPIRVELKALTAEDFVRILTEPDASLTEQYVALMETEGVVIDFTEDAIEKIAEVAWQVNEEVENIGARRLHTVMERLLDSISYEASDRSGETVIIDAKYVVDHLDVLAKDRDLSKYIL